MTMQPLTTSAGSAMSPFRTTSWYHAAKSSPRESDWRVRHCVLLQFASTWRLAHAAHKPAEPPTDSWLLLNLLRGQALLTRRSDNRPCKMEEEIGRAHV